MNQTREAKPPSPSGEKGIRVYFRHIGEYFESFMPADNLSDVGVLSWYLLRRYDDVRVVIE